LPPALRNVCRASTTTALARAVTDGAVATTTDIKEIT
jgi:hypothetical protein